MRKKPMAAFPGDLFVRDIFELDIAEYSSTSITTHRARAKQVSTRKVQFSFFRLAVAAAKSILTNAPQSIDRWKKVRAAFYNLDCIVSTNSVPFALCDGFRREYRDFSKTSRIGELAQAITFILAQDVLKYPVVLDFDGYLASQGIPALSTDEQTPDYAMLMKTGSTQLSLIESKGSCPDVDVHHPKGPLGEALKQCGSGNDHIFKTAGYKATNTYGTHVRFAESGDGWRTVAAYCDPEDPAANGLMDPLNAIRYYYSGWLVLGGYYEYAARMARGALAVSDIESWAPTEYGGQEYLVPDNPVKQSMFSPFFSFRRPSERPTIPNEWAIDGRLIKAIVDEDLHSVLGLFSEEAQVQTDSERRVVTFRDLTLCSWA